MHKHLRVFQPKNMTTVDFVSTVTCSLTNFILIYLGNRSRSYKKSCLTQLSMKFSCSTVGISTFMSRQNSILGLSEREKC